MVMNLNNNETKQSSVILDAEILNNEQKQELIDLGYNAEVCFYGSGYDTLPMLCWSVAVDDADEWEEENLPDWFFSEDDEEEFYNEDDFDLLFIDEDEEEF